MYMILQYNVKEGGDSLRASLGDLVLLEVTDNPRHVLHCQILLYQHSRAHIHKET